MNFKKEESLLANVKMAPRDAILGLTETYVADPNPKKVNLGVGVYYDDQGKVPLLECVRRADEALTAARIARPYLAMDGFPEFVRAVQTLLFGADHPAVAQGRVTTVQAVGGTGGLKVGADFIRRFAPEAVLYMSDPSYDNHRPLFEEAGFRVETYPYYDPRTRGIRFAEMIEFLRGVPKGSVALLHACCHNPTGVDIRGKQWKDVIKVVAAVLASPELSALWRKEVLVMRDRVRSMRRELVEGLKKRIPDDFGFILQQRGIFSYSGLAREQMVAMRERYSVYGIESGRICVAALNPRNLDYVADAIAATVALSAAELSKPRAAA